MNVLIKKEINRALNHILSKQHWRARFYRHLPAALDHRGKLETEDYKIIDRIYSHTRRLLENNPRWRYGTAHVHDSAKWAFDKLKKYISLEDCHYADLGCGVHQPYGVSTVFYLNGASSSIASDILDIEDSKRAAEAMFDLLADCCLLQNNWCWTEISRDEYMNRISKFDLEALKAGDLFQGVRNVPIKHMISDIYSPSINPESFDAMTSRAVLEHFINFELAVENLHRLMKPGGIAYHLIDLVDHRAYAVLKKYHYWSFLEEENWEGHTNRLRAHEIIEFLNSAGFQILDIDIETADLPTDVRQNLKGRFRDMTNEQLEIIRMGVLIKK